MSARAPPKGCSLPRILPLRLGSSLQQVAGIPPSGRGGGGRGEPLGDAEASGNLIETLVPEPPCNTAYGVGPVQTIAPLLERAITHSLLYSLYFGLELEQRVRTCLGPAIWAAVLAELGLLLLCRMGPRVEPRLGK